MIPADLRSQSPMLASPSKDAATLVATLTDRGEHIFDVKWDGVRALAYVDKGEVCLRNRNGVEITSRYPEVVEALRKRFRRDTVVLDGELVVFSNTTGCPDFDKIAKRDAQSVEAKIKRLSEVMPATFMAFDILWWDKLDLRHVALDARLAYLRTACAKLEGNPRLMLSTSSPDGRALWAIVEANNLEGLIAKKWFSHYYGRRDQAWLKLKRTHRVTCVVTGYEEGEGSRRGKIGALFISMVDHDGNLVPVGKVGSGLRESDHGPMLEILNLGERFFVEVETTERTKQGQLRFPAYKGVRVDCTLDDCTIDQLETA